MSNVGNRGFASRINEFKLPANETCEKLVSLAGNENSLILSAKTTFCRLETGGWMDGWVLSKYRFLGFQSGFKVVSKWFQSGFKVVSKWFQSGFKVVSNTCLVALSILGCER